MSILIIIIVLDSYNLIYSNRPVVMKFRDYWSRLLLSPWTTYPLPFPSTYLLRRAIILILILILNLIRILILILLLIPLFYYSSIVPLSILTFYSE